MKLPNLTTLINPLHKKNNATIFTLALQIGKSISKAAIFSGTTKYKIEDVEKASTPSEVVENILKKFPTTKNVVFGLPNSYVDGTTIKESHLIELKRIADEAKVKPLGFVVIHEAIAHYLEVQSNAPQTAIFIGFDDEKLTFSLFRIGTCVQMEELSRTDQLYQDFEKGLSLFTSTEILPSKLVLYDGDKDLDDIKEQLLSYPWQKNQQFLHVPKIEVLPWETSIRAVVDAGVSELQNSLSMISPEPTQPTSSSIVSQNEPIDAVDQNQELLATDTSSLTANDSEESNESNEPDSSDNEDVDIDEESPDELIIHDGSIPSTQDDIPQQKKDISINQPTTKAGDFGFTLQSEKQSSHPLQNKPLENQAPTFQKPAVHADDATKKPIQSRLLTTPKFSNPIKLPTLPALPGSKAIVVSVIALMLLSAGIFSLAFWYPKATLSLIAQPNIITNDVTLTLDTAIAQVDTSTKRIPGKLYTVTVSGETSNETSGKKTIGEKASGEVLVYNKTSQSKTLAKGTVLSASSVSFTLDQDVSVASASDSGESLTYGKEKAKVTATKIGPSGNLKGDTEFTVGNNTTSSVYAKSESDFSGGTEREIAVVSQSDQNKVVDALTKKLAEEAKNQLQSQLGDSEHFLTESLKSNIVSKRFDKEVGDESDNLNATVTLEFSQISYKQSDLDSFFNEYMSQQLSNEYLLDTSKSYFTVDKTDINDDGSLTVSAKFFSYLLPKVDISSLPETYAGKNAEQLKEAVSGLADKKIIGYDIHFERKLPFLSSSLPFNKDNIQINIVPY